MTVVFHLNLNRKSQVKQVLNFPARKSDVRAYNIQKVMTGRGDEYTTGCPLDFSYFKEYLKMTAIDLCKQQALDAHPKAKLQISFTGNLE